MSDKNGAIWDMTSFFPEFNGAEMLEFKRVLAEGAAQLQKDAAAIGPLSAETAEQWEKVLLKTEDMYARLTHMFSYISCLRAADAMNEAYSQELAQLMRIAAEFEKYEVDVLHAFKAATDSDFETFVARKALAPIAHSIRKTRE